MHVIQQLHKSQAGVLGVPARRCHDVTVRCIGRLRICEGDDHVFMYHVHPSLDGATGTTVQQYGYLI